jgi:hypothetical protein
METSEGRLDYNNDICGYDGCLAGFKPNVLVAKVSRDSLRLKFETT